MSHAFGILTTFLSAFFSSKVFFAKVWQLRMNLRAALFLPFYWQLFPQHFLCRCRIFVICLVSIPRTSTCYYRVGFYLQRISFLICRSHQKLLNIDLMLAASASRTIKLPIWQTIRQSQIADSPLVLTHSN